MRCAVWQIKKEWLASLCIVTVCRNVRDGLIKKMGQNFRIMEIDVDDVPWKDDIVTYVPEIEEGYLKLPKGPGWGVELNEEAIREHPPIGIQNSAAGSS